MLSQMSRLPPRRFVVFVPVPEPYADALKPRATALCLNDAEAPSYETRVVRREPPRDAVLVPDHVDRYHRHHGLPRSRTASAVARTDRAFQPISPRSPPDRQYDVIGGLPCSPSHCPRTPSLNSDSASRAGRCR